MQIHLKDACSLNFYSIRVLFKEKKIHLYFQKKACEKKFSKKVLKRKKNKPYIVTHWIASLNIKFVKKK